jgi:hypothetical protein
LTGDGRHFGRRGRRNAGSKNGAVPDRGGFDDIDEVARRRPTTPAVREMTFGDLLRKAAERRPIAWP